MRFTARFGLIAVAAMALLMPAAVTSPAQAQQLTFDNAVDGGTLTYDGALGSDTLDGANILFDSILGTGTASNDGVELYCADNTTDATGSCTLNFSTGVSNTEGSDFVIFDGGGTFTLTGAAWDCGNDGCGDIGDVLIADGTLITGTWTGGGITPSVTCDASGACTGAGNGSDTKDADLAAFYGLDENFTFSSTQITIESCTTDPAGGFSCTVSEADMTNTGTVARVPEPATLGIFGIGLIGLGFVMRRRKRHAA